MAYDDAEIQLAAALQGIPLEQAALQAKMRRAQGLMDTPGAQGAQIGRVYRAGSPLEHLATALSRGLGASQMKGAEKDLGGLAGRQTAAAGAAARIERGDKDREFGLRSAADQRLAASQAAAAELANAQAMAREADAARDAKYQADTLGLKRSELGLKREEMTAAGARQAADTDAKAKAAQVKAAEDLRKEFQGLQTYKNTQTIGESYKKIAGTSENGPGDVSLIYSYMRMVDPGSTVREGEFATAAQAGAIPDRVVGLYNRAIAGEKLPPEVRKQFREEAKNLLKAQVDRYEETAKPYRRLAEQSGASPADVVLDLGLGQYLEPTSAATGPVAIRTKAERDALPAGAQYVGPDGKVYTKR